MLYSCIVFLGPHLPDTSFLQNQEVGLLLVVGGDDLCSVALFALCSASLVRSRNIYKEGGQGSNTYFLTSVSPINTPHPPATNRKLFSLDCYADLQFSMAQILINGVFSLYKEILRIQVAINERAIRYKVCYLQILLNSSSQYFIIFPD